MRICLVNPPKTYQVWAGVPDIFNGPDAYLFPPLGIMYLSSYLKKNTTHQPFLFDCVASRWGAEEVAREIAGKTPDVLGVTSNTHNLVNVVEVIRAVKALLPDIFVMIGGSHVTSFPGKAARLPGVDAAVRGDGEETLERLLDHLESGTDWMETENISFVDEGGRVRINRYTPPTDQLDVYPFPDREGLVPEHYYTPGMRAATATTIISSRGCPYNCAFCSVPRHYRSRSPEDIVDELEYCSHKLGIKEFHFIDDLFNITASRVIEISRLILERKLKILWGCKAGCTGVTEEMLKIAGSAGCIRMHYGVETWSDAGLEAIGKKTRVADIRRAFALTKKAGIRAIAYMIIGCPHEKTPEEVMNSLIFVKTLKPDYVVFSLYTPYPDAPVFKAGIEKGLWAEDSWDGFMLDPTREYNLPTVWTEYMNKKQLVELLKRVHNGFYFDPVILVRTLASMRTISEIIRLIRGGLILLKLQFLPAASRRI